MKKFICIFVISVFFAPAVYAKSDVLCKVGGEIYSARTHTGLMDCNEPLSYGEACFTGKRSEVIELINSGYFNWDEEWLEQAHYVGTNSIGYLFVDGPNDQIEKVRINRCKKDFLK